MSLHKQSLRCASESRMQSLLYFFFGSASFRKHVCRLQCCRAGFLAQCQFCQVSLMHLRVPEERGSFLTKTTISLKVTSIFSMHRVSKQDGAQEKTEGISSLERRLQHPLVGFFLRKQCSGTPLIGVRCNRHWKISSSLTKLLLHLLMHISPILCGEVLYLSFFPTSRGISMFSRAFACRTSLAVEIAAGSLFAEDDHMFS